MFPFCLFRSSLKLSVVVNLWCFHLFTHVRFTQQLLFRNQKCNESSVAVDKTIIHILIYNCFHCTSVTNFVGWTLDATECLFDWNWTSLFYTFVSNTDLLLYIILLHWFAWYLCFFVWMCSTQLELGKTHTKTLQAMTARKKNNISILRTRDVTTMNERKNTPSLLCLFGWELIFIWYRCMHMCMCVCVYGLWVWVFVLESQKIEKIKFTSKSKATNGDSPEFDWISHTNCTIFIFVCAHSG